MKNLLLKICFQCILLIFCLGISSIMAQTSYHYPLQANFNEANNAAPALTTWPNAQGQTGSFATRSLPPTTCQGIGQFSGYEYADNAGLRFGFPTNFINCAYSIQFTWRYDNPGGLQEWIRLLSFVYTDDAGLDLWTQSPSTQGTLHYWYLNPVFQFPGFCLAQPTLSALSPSGYFNGTDYYQLTITRNCSGLMTVYANGALAGSFTDIHQRYVPHNNQIVFFRDTADTSCYPTAFPNEASSGFIKDLVIADYVFTAAQVDTAFQNFCPQLLPLTWEYVEVEVLDQGNTLHWGVNKPEMVERFEISGSFDGQNYELLNKLYTIHGNTANQASFSFLDRKSAFQRTYYKIQAIDFDGHVHTSEIQEAWPEKELQVYPNPAQDFVFINASDHTEKTVEILDLQGKQLRKYAIQTGQNRISLTGLPAGMLILRIGHEQLQILRKLH